MYREPQRILICQCAHGDLHIYIMVELVLFFCDMPVIFYFAAVR